MNEIILYTQRVEVVAGYNERRDCADQQIADFIWACGFTPVPVNNLPEYAEEIACRLHPSGILLTGGNDLAKYGGNAPERDQTEQNLVEYAIRENIPLLGFCRGMQFLADYFGNPLVPVENHVGSRHMVMGSLRHEQVNSYHHWGLTTVKEPLYVLAHAEDGVIEAIRHKQRQIMGIMWHPEREMPFMENDIRLFSDFLRGVW